MKIDPCFCWLSSGCDQVGHELLPESNASDVPWLKCEHKIKEWMEAQGEQVR